MSLLSGPIYIMSREGDGDTLALQPQPDGSSVLAATAPKESERDPAFQWEFLAAFQNDGLALGLLLRHVASDRFMRANPDVLDGGGVVLVSRGEVDYWCGWVCANAVGDPPYFPILAVDSIRTGYWTGLNIKGGTSQIITYHHENIDNDLWCPRVRRDPPFPPSDRAIVRP